MKTIINQIFQYRLYRHIARFYIRIILLLTILIPSNSIHAQTIDPQKSIVAYIYNLAGHFDWANEKSLKEFSIVVLSDNKTLQKELEKLAEIALIKEKPINLIFNKKDINYSSVQIVFIAEDKATEYETIIKKTNSYPILVITQNFPNREIIMLNLYDARNNKIRFEMNRTVIVSRKLKIDNELLLQESINKMDRNSDSLDFEIAKQKRSIVLHDSILREKEIEMSKKDSQLKSNLVAISNQISLIEDQKATLWDQKNAIVAKESKIKKSNILLQSQLQEVRLLSSKQKQVMQDLNQGNRKLLQQQQQLGLMDSVISKNTVVLGEQKTIISKQQKSMRFSYAIIFLSILIIIIILNGLAIIKKKNKTLQAQKLEIEHGNTILQNTNEELYATNNQLTEALDKLRETQTQLVQSEKMASLGVLTAGIAHELNNPINFVYAGVNSMKKDFKDIDPILESFKDLDNTTENIQVTIDTIKQLKTENEFDEAYNSIKQTISDISLGAERAADIIKGLSRFSRIEKDEWEFFDIHESLENVLLLLKNKYKYHIEIT